MNNLSGSLSFHGNVSGQMGSNLITNVEANPSGTPTGILTSIRVGDIIYSIPTGGGVTSYSLLTDKPQINSVVLTGNKTSDDLDLSNKAHVNELSGASVDFQNGQELPLLKCIADIEPVQSGSGTPSPDNIRPITGWTDVTITVSNDDKTKTYTAALGQTVYGGHLNVLTGELTDEDGSLLVFNSGNTNVWSGAATSPQGITRFYTTPSYVGRTLVISDTYKVSPNYATEIGVITMSNDGRIIITPSFGQGKTLNEFKALLADNPFNVLMTLARPQTVQLTPEKVRTIMGVNNISANTGDINIIYINNVNDPAIEFILNNL